MRTIVSLLALIILASIAASVSAQFQQQDPNALQLGDSQTQYWQSGVILRAGRSNCFGLVGYTTVPGDWPEQQIAVVEQGEIFFEPLDARLQAGAPTWQTWCQPRLLCLSVAAEQAQESTFQPQSSFAIDEGEELVGIEADQMEDQGWHAH